MIFFFAPIKILSCGTRAYKVWAGNPFIRSAKMADGKEKVTKQFIQSRLDDHEADLSACGISTFPTKELVSRSLRIALTLQCTGGLVMCSMAT